MTHWSSKPIIYEINTRVWLTDLSRRFKKKITLKNIPDVVLDEIAALNADTIWLMGVWQRSEAARLSALNYTHEYKPVLPDLQETDVIGSAYAIADYTVDKAIGGKKALAALRERLRERGLKLILDYVPNHVSTDHHWIDDHPEYMVPGTKAELKKFPDRFFAVDDSLIIAHGRDPYFPGWIDTAQINAFSLEYREVALKTLLDIAEQCDGVRCDMAMLMVNSVFQDTWGEHLDPDTFPVPETEYWEDIIPEVRKRHPDFKFIAEVYWNMEYTLLQQGFDFTYDKTLYDRLLEGNTAHVREHLLAPIEYQQQQVRFIENHDEPRAASSLGIERSRPAAVLVCTLPGAVLLHDGQFTGRRIKLPVQIGRQPYEPSHAALRSFYTRLLAETRHPIYHRGTWRLFPVTWPHDGTQTHHNIIAYGWRLDEEYRLILVNQTYVWSQGFVDLSDWPTLNHHKWGLRDVLSGSYAFHDGHTIMKNGFYVELEGYQSVILRFEWIDMHRIEDFLRIAGESWQF